jgi:hypothetical protein
MFFDNPMLFCSCPIVSLVPLPTVATMGGNQDAQAGLICSSGFEWTKNFRSTKDPYLP